MNKDLYIKYSQCRAALQIVSNYVDRIEATLAMMACPCPELFTDDTFCDVGEALDFFRDNLNALIEKIDKELERNGR